MSESAQHQKLVNMIIEHVETIVGQDKKCFISSDEADGMSLSPLTAEGFRPDVFYQYGDTLIIGEAKTSDDVGRLHSREQYDSYLKKCALFDGKAHFIAAVHWGDKAQLHNILRKIKTKHPGDYTITILEGY